MTIGTRLTPGYAAPGAAFILETLLPEEERYEPNAWVEQLEVRI